MSGIELSDRPYRGLWPFLRMVAGSSAGGRLVELDGVIATVVPVTPKRSVLNSVAYTSAERLSEALDALAMVYDGAAVRAWTVWVPEEDRAAQQVLADAGHELDANPRAMAMELRDFDRPASDELEVERKPRAADIGRINDVAYGFDGDFSRAFTRQPDGLNLYAARIDGRAVACVGSIHDDGDCGIYLVATDPAARGRGLAHELMTVALRDGREAGCETASLQSTAMGRSIYERLGLRDFGAIQMWERRAT